MAVSARRGASEMVTLSNVACSTDYADAATIGPIVNARSIIFSLIPDTSSPGASGIMQVAPLGYPAQQWGPEIPIAPTIGSTIVGAAGARFRNSVAGQIVRVTAQLSQPGDATITGGTPTDNTISSSGAVTPPASGVTVLGYVELTAAQTVAATTEGAATAIITGPSVTYDGATAVTFQAFFPRVVSDGAIQFVLFDVTNGISLGKWDNGSATTRSPSLFRRFTPAAGALVHAVAAFRTGGTTGGNIVTGGPGAAGQFLPGFLKISSGS